jgi:hypothetical protein
MKRGGREAVTPKEPAASPPRRQSPGLTPEQQRASAAASVVSALTAPPASAAAAVAVADACEPTPVGSAGEDVDPPAELLGRGAAWGLSAPSCLPEHTPIHTHASTELQQRGPMCQAREEDAVSGYENTGTRDSPNPTSDSPIPTTSLGGHSLMCASPQTYNPYPVYRYSTHRHSVKHAFPAIVAAGVCMCRGACTGA